MTHTTKGIVLRTVKYGETSVITTVYTELFGIQSYIVKGVRKDGKKNAGKASYFQPAAILDMVVYHNELKQLQFVKEYSWAHLYNKILFEVVRNSVAQYIIELLQHTLKEPEANPEMYYMIEDTLLALDNGDETLAANLPLYFSLKLGAGMGFQLQGNYTTDTPVCDYWAGNFVTEVPAHQYYLEGELSQHTSLINSLNSYNDLTHIRLNQKIRSDLLQAYQQYIALHINDFGSLKSLPILQEVLKS